MRKIIGSTRPAKPASKKRNTAAYHHGDLREALLAAARTALETGTAETISLKALASQLGVSQSAPYRHFRTRESLLAALAADGFLQFRADIQAAAQSDGPEPDWVRCCLAYLDFSRRNPGLYRLMFASELLHLEQDIEAPLRSNAKLAFSDLLKRVHAAVPFPTAATAAWIWMTLHGLAMVEMAGVSLSSGLQELAAIDVIREMVHRLQTPHSGSDGVSPFNPEHASYAPR